MWHRARWGMLALNGAQTFPAAPELLFRMIERRRVALHPDLDIRINVSRDRPEPAQFLGCLSILAHAPDLTAMLSHDIIKAVSVDRGDAGLTEDEAHAPIVPASTPRWPHPSLNGCARFDWLDRLGCLPHRFPVLENHANQCSEGFARQPNVRPIYIRN
jgi:hypothetical protein